MADTLYAPSPAAMAVRERVAARITTIRKPTGTRQNELAVACDFGPDEFSQRMTGRVAFDLDELADIARALDVDIAALLTEEA